VLLSAAAAAESRMVCYCSFPRKRKPEDQTPQ
jgi:hypothetical protein